MREKEARLLEAKRLKISEELQSNQKALREKDRIEQAEAEGRVKKKETFKEGIEEMRKENRARRALERDFDERLNERGKGFFPFTHGDNVENEREVMRQELRQEFQEKQANSALLIPTVSL